MIRTALSSSHRNPHAYLTDVKEKLIMTDMAPGAIIRATVHPQLDPTRPVIGPHYQYWTRETLHFTGQAWWRELTNIQTVAVPKSSRNAVVAVVLIGLLFWPLWLLLIGMIGSKMETRYTPTGSWELVAPPTPAQRLLMLSSMSTALPELEA